MTESFLHYVWQFQYFDKKELSLTTGENLTILKPGILNTDAGPDFSQAKVKIDQIAWAGSIEIHLHSSGWYDHQHDADAAYENVVLHVVWEEDRPVYRKDGSRLPTVTLNKRVEPHLLKSYLNLVNNPASIPCQNSFAQVSDLIRHSMIDKAVMQRLERKAGEVLKVLDQNQGDWEETVYQLLAASFGFKVNTDPFRQLAKALPYKLILKHRDQPHQLEALLFGQAGFLVARSKDAYLTRLVNEYQFLERKYNLSTTRLNVAQWKFMRLRPANFPTLRVAQFAAFLRSTENIFSAILEAAQYEVVESLLTMEPSLYWKTHYRFGKKAKAEIQGFGEASREMVVINAIAPLLVAYGKSGDEHRYIDQAVRILQAVRSESNKIITLWKKLGCASQHAWDSQGLIELFNNFCQRRECLNCSIGSAILKPARA
ncbi:MAG: DUF2851 family protein [Cyclobacteriaceae bacterium]|nr:DUF2851 family protein [Cyclobacteriaceae bacterium]